MPAAGRSDSKYVRKIHYGWPNRLSLTHWLTSCGKNVRRIHTTRDISKITCKTCRNCFAYWQNREEP